MKRHGVLLCLCSCLLLLACANVSQAGTQIDLSPFVISSDSGWIRMDGAGNVFSTAMEYTQSSGTRFYEARVEKISKDGRVYNAKGKLVATLRQDNMLVSSKGEVLFEIKPDGGIVDQSSGTKLFWDEGGVLHAGDKTLDMRLSPVLSSARTAAAVALSLQLAPLGKPKVTETPGEK
jgi:hypothetical protein